ncbi:uncharacterized protein LOC121720940 isoform X3 [Alosa sapidissima]|uniref:uncharacterized protein LOC121720940 isoform X3 n=1 Tax=Alosa sapidissima TaxID=34773 RepID=UPI001C08DF9B|nr:uncharacterized protein LOC121720940 isoform X3 [Alosa sapidissima]
MTTATPRRMLILQIIKQLPALSSSQLQSVARSIEDGGESTEGLSEPELYDLIIDYTRSERLKAMEDEGMAQLLSLRDLLQELTSADSGSGEVCVSTVRMDGTLTPTHQLLPPATRDIHPHSSVDIHTHPSSTDLHIHPLFTDTHTHLSSMDMHTHTSLMDRDVHAPAPTGRPAQPSVIGIHGAHHGRTSLSSTVTDQVVRLSDVTALLPRRECKIHSGQISDTCSDISFNGLCKQIDTALQEGFSEAEIIRAVLKITKPGTFREMLTNHDDLTVNGLKRFLRSHIRDKSVTELFQELSNARQHDRESPQQFLYRLMGLKQRVIFESQQPGVEFSYDRRLVQGTFLHTLYQGLNERNTYVRHDIKPFLSDMQVSDDFLLEQMTKSMTEEEGRLKRLGAVAKSRPVTVSIAQYDHDGQTDATKPSQVDVELQANRAAIRELTAQVSSLTRHMTLVDRSAEPWPTLLPPPMALWCSLMCSHNEEPNVSLHPRVESFQLHPLFLGNSLKGNQLPWGISLLVLSLLEL